MLLPAGHGDGVVVEDLVGDVHTRRDRLADGEQAGVEIGAVAQIGEDVLFADERRFAHPGHAFAAHLGEGFGAVHPQRHDVAADAGERALAFRRLGGGVVWAAGAEIGAAFDRGDVRGRFAGLIAEEGECGADPVGVVEMLQARGDHVGDDARRKFIVRAQQPFAALVMLANDARADGLAPVIQLPFQLMFDEFALFLDHQYFIQAFRKGAHAVGLQRPRHADLVDLEANVRSDARIDAEFVQRFHRVGKGLAGGNDADAGLGRIPHHPVNAVGLGKGHGGKALVTLQAGIFLAPDVAGADVDAAIGEFKFRDDDGTVLVRQIDGGAGFYRIGRGLEADPGAGKAAHGQPKQAIFDEFMHRRGRQERHEGRLEVMVALVGQGGGFGAVIIAHDSEHAAMRRRAGGVAVFQHVHGAIEAGALAVPDAEDAIALRRRVERNVLAAPDGGGAQFFVHAGNEVDILFLQPLLGAPKLLIITAQRRAAITGNETAGVQPGGGVAPFLHQRQPHQRLHARHEHAAFAEAIFVFEADRR